MPFVLSWSLGWQHIVIYTHYAIRINSTAVPGLCCKQFPIASKGFEPFLLYCWCPVAARIYCYLQHLRHPVNYMTVPGLCCTDFSLSAMIPSLYFCLYTYIHAFFICIYIHISMHAQISYIYISLSERVCLLHCCAPLAGCTNVLLFTARSALRIKFTAAPGLCSYCRQWFRDVQLVSQYCKPGLRCSACKRGCVGCTGMQTGGMQTGMCRGHETVNGEV